MSPLIETIQYCYLCKDVSKPKTPPPMPTPYAFPAASPPVPSPGILANRSIAPIDHRRHDSFTGRCPFPPPTFPALFIPLPLPPFPAPFPAPPFAPCASSSSSSSASSCSAPPAVSTDSVRLIKNAMKKKEAKVAQTAPNEKSNRRDTRKGEAMGARR